MPTRFSVNHAPVQMGKLLQIDVKKSKDCLSCHGVLIENETLRQESIENKFNPEEGVGCVACMAPMRSGFGFTLRFWKR